MNNLGINSTVEYGAAVGVYLVNQFGSIESAPRSEFIDWYVCSPTITLNLMQCKLCTVIPTIHSVLAILQYI